MLHAQILLHMHCCFSKPFMVWVIIVVLLFQDHGSDLACSTCVMNASSLVISLLWSPSFHCFHSFFYPENIANSASLHPNRSRGALRSSRHPRLPQGPMLGGAPERGLTRAVWCGGFNYAHPTDTTITRRHWLLWVLLWDMCTHTPAK